MSLLPHVFSCTTIFISQIHTYCTIEGEGEGGSQVGFEFSLILIQNIRECFRAGSLFTDTVPVKTCRSESRSTFNN